MNKYSVSFLSGMAIMLAASGAMWLWLGQAASHIILMVNAVVAIVLLLVAVVFAYVMTKDTKIEPLGIFIVLGGAFGAAISITAAACKSWR